MFVLLVDHGDQDIGIEQESWRRGAGWGPPPRGLGGRGFPALPRGFSLARWRGPPVEGNATRLLRLAVER